MFEHYFDYRNIVSGYLRDFTSSETDFYHKASAKYTCTTEHDGGPKLISEGHNAKVTRNNVFISTVMLKRSLPN